MTIREANRHIFNQLKTIYDEPEAENISDWVLEHLTGAKKTDRVIHKEKLISAEQALQLNHYLSRLLQHDPVQYVLNEAWFCGLKFYVDKNVLIPRPETEELVEWIISDCKFPIDTLSILDIGTGSGCIPIALKKRLGKADVWSCDISPEALKVANRNAMTLGIQVKFIELNFLDKKQRDKLSSFDIVVSNPPYIPVKDKETMRQNVLAHEPASALFVPDNDALIFYKAIAEFGKNHLAKNGIIYTEINESLGKATATMFESNGYKTVIKKDMQGKDRMIKAFIN
ncbi:MAG TPA: peptide chain release factor N(5)-glutamine methyltransferase [Chitinophagaceae bacterium]|nr:peptide chain release factor N(5)-glutamine methyltransferase [Chitinophagaceae bacterium]